LVDKPEQESKSPWKKLPFSLRLFLLASAAFIIGLASVNYIAMPVIVHRSGVVDVPSLTGLPLVEAEAALSEVGLSLRQVGSVYDAEILEGRVVKQEPIAGSAVRKARSVSVLLSKGPDVATVPELQGESLRHARMILSRVGLGQGSVARTFSTQVASDYVIGTDPPAGTSLLKGSAVSILVSLGAEGSDFVMPDLTGRPLYETAFALEDMGFTVTIVGHRRPSLFGRHEETIESQQPLPGKRVRKGDEIQLFFES
jgi:beta-lactam-binding protein with PASTA domain